MRVCPFSSSISLICDLLWTGALSIMIRLFGLSSFSSISFTQLVTVLCVQLLSNSMGANHSLPRCAIIRLTRPFFLLPVTLPCIFVPRLAQPCGRLEWAAKPLSSKYMMFWLLLFCTHSRSFLINNTLFLWFASTYFIVFFNDTQALQCHPNRIDMHAKMSRTLA